MQIINMLSLKWPICFSPHKLVLLKKKKKRQQPQSFLSFNKDGFILKRDWFQQDSKWAGGDRSQLPPEPPSSLPDCAEPRTLCPYPVSVISEHGDIQRQDIWRHFGGSNGFLIWNSFCISVELDGFFSQSFCTSSTRPVQGCHHAAFQWLESKKKVKAVLSADLFQQIVFFNFRKELIGNTSQNC